MAALQRKYRPWWPFLTGLVVMGIIFVGGVCGYMLIEGWGLLDSLYMVVITLSTVGFTEIHPMSAKGRVFTMGLILSGVGTFAYLIGSFTQLLAEGRLQHFLGRRRMQLEIDKLSGHFIICGFGRIGSIVAKQLQREGHPLVVVEREQELLEEMEALDILHVHGDATSDETLLAAGLSKAKTLITALTQEAANVYVTLTARQLNPELTIVARADAESHISRLKRAGADRVVLPTLIGGLRMAQTVLKPTATDLMEVALGGNMELQMEELPVCAGSHLAGRDLKSSGIRPRLNVIIIAIKKKNDAMVFNPGPDTLIEESDTLIAIGRPDHLQTLREGCVLPSARSRVDWA